MSSPVAFAKLYSGILHSTLWCEPDRTRLVWITMLAMCDQYGRVSGSIPGLANAARVPVEDARIAIKAFLSPDPDSRTRDFEGRRIEEIDGGWRLLNHAKYRDLRSDDDRREQNRQAQARLREKKKAASSGVSNSQHKSAESAHTDTDAYADANAVEEISSLRDSSPGGDQLALDDPALAKPIKPPKVPNCPYDLVFAAYHEQLPGLPKVRMMDDPGRRASILKLWKWVFTSVKSDRTPRATNAEEGIAWVRGYFGHAAQNDFVMGRTPRGPGHENWQADIDYLLSRSGMKQVIEKTRTT